MFAIAIHGGAGSLPRTEMTREREAAYRAGLVRALDAGRTVLAGGGAAVDAVTVAAAALEDDPLFNAGRGAVFNADGRHELDAAIMDGRTRRAGAVCGLMHVANPVRLARAVSPFTISHVGTVGAVALDSAGGLAAATSTGGMTGKRWGRIGDSPIIGAGTYADGGCAVSGTGHGEMFIRAAVAHDICARIRHGGRTLTRAVHEVVFGELADLGGEGGVIAVDALGNVAAEFNSEGMFRASIREGEAAQVAIYRTPG